MANVLYKVAPIELPRSRYRKIGQNNQNEFRSYSIADQLLIFVFVHDGSGVWGNFDTVIDIKGDIVDVGALKRGFDDEENKIVFENITFKVLNDFGHWSSILDNKVTSEMKIVRAFPSYTTPNTYDDWVPLFYGVINKSNIDYSVDETPDSPYWLSYREYEFTVISYLSLLKKAFILDLYSALDDKEGDYYVCGDVCVENQNLAVGDKPERGGVHNEETWYTPLVYNGYIQVWKIIEGIFEVVYDNVEVNIKSDIEFYTRNNNTDIYYLDKTRPKNENVCILFCNASQGLRSYGQLFGASSSQAPNKFFGHEDCLSLLKELMISFGLIWRARYEKDGQAMWDFRVVVDLTTRLQGDDMISVDVADGMHNDVKGSIEDKEYTGVRITVVGHGDVTNYTQQGNTLVQAPYNKKMKSFTTPFVSAQRQKNGSYMANWQNLYGGKSFEFDTLQPLDQFDICRAGKPRETYPVTRHPLTEQQEDPKGSGKYKELDTREQAKHKLYYGEMLANYYSGLYSGFVGVEHILTFTHDSMGWLPLDLYSVGGMKYIVLSVEEDIFNGSSKLKLKEI
jgi:hypothetical protein